MAINIRKCEPSPAFQSGVILSVVAETDQFGAMLRGICIYETFLKGFSALY